MKARHLPFGVLFEMARLVSLNRLPEVHVADLDKLHGSNAAAAPQTASVLLKQQMPDEEVAISHEKSTVVSIASFVAVNCSHFVRSFHGKNSTKKRRSSPMTLTGAWVIAQNTQAIMEGRSPFRESSRLTATPTKLSSTGPDWVLHANCGECLAPRAGSASKCQVTSFIASTIILSSSSSDRL